MKTLLFKVEGQRITRIDNIIPVAKCRNLYKAHFDFLTPEWEGTKTAIFSQRNYSKAQILDEKNECMIPWEFFDTEINIRGSVTVFCGDLVTANSTYVDIEKAGYQNSDATVPPTPDVHQQMIDILNAAKKIAQGVRDDADAGKFHGENGESAYQIAVRLGFHGTEQEWIESLKYNHSEEFTKLAEEVRNTASNIAAERQQITQSSEDITRLKEDISTFSNDTSIKYSPVNACDESKITPNKFMGLDGTVSENESYRYTDYIPVKSGDIVRFYRNYGNEIGGYKLEATNVRFLTVFNAEKKAVKAKGKSEINQYVVDDGINFIVASFFYNQYCNGYEVTINQEAVKYEKYHEPYYRAKEEYLSDAVDNTLSKPNVPADAQTVGKELKKINIDDVIDNDLIYSSNLLKEVKSGYHFNGVANEDPSYCYSNKINVTEGETLTVQYGRGASRTLATIRWVDEYASDGVAHGKVVNATSYKVPSNVKEVIVSSAESYMSVEPAIIKGLDVLQYEPYFEPYPKRIVRYSKLQKPIHVYLPKTIYVAIGRTIELYNDLVCLEASKYHFHWGGNIGVGYKRKVSIQGKTTGKYLLTLEITDDELNVIYKGSSQVFVVENKITITKNIIPIGDSLTNLKVWLGEVEKLSDSKIKYIGTRGRTDSQIRHEGRSGWDASIYNTDFNYAFDNNYQGVETVKSSDNPFWDGTKFSLKHYVDTQGAKVGIPDAVQIFLGTNGLSLDNTENANNIKTLVDLIRSEYTDMPIFVCNTIYRSNQDGYRSTGSDGYNTSMSGYQFEEDCKIMDLQNRLDNLLKGYSEVYIVPLSVCMDRDNNFGQASVPVNPRLTNVTRNIAVESVHPQESGYLQMADVMYSTYCGVLK